MSLYIARGSAGEVRSMLCFLEHRYTDLQSQIPNLKSLAESCSRQLRGWADHLQNSDIQGQRQLNDNARRQYRSKKDAEEFEAHLQRVLEGKRP